MQVSTTAPLPGYVAAKSVASDVTNYGTQSEETASTSEASASAPSAGFNLSSLLSSDAVSSVLSTQADGKLVWHDPSRLLTNQEVLASNAVSSQNIASKDNDHFSSAFSTEEKALIRQTTGFNVVTFDSGLQQVVDDQGNLATGPSAMAAAHTAMAMVGDRESSLKGGISADYFDNLFNTAAAAGQSYPADVITKVKDWFDTGLKTVSDSHKTGADAARAQIASEASDTINDGQVSEAITLQKTKEVTLTYSQAEDRAISTDNAVNASPNLRPGNSTIS